MHQEGPHYTVCAGVLSTEYKSTPQFSTPYSEPWAFSDTSSWHPLREVTIETGQSACDRPKSETARIVWNPIAALASIYKVIHSFWQRLLSPWTPHFHENQQNAPAQRTEWYSEDTGIDQMKHNTTISGDDNTFSPKQIMAVQMTYQKPQKTKNIMSA